MSFIVLLENVLLYKTVPSTSREHFWYVQFFYLTSALLMQEEFVSSS